MIEVKRYDPDFDAQEIYELGEVVSGADFDRVTAERDAALEEVEALKHWRDLALQFDNHRMKALWHLKTLVSDGAHYDAAAAFLAEPPIPASELQQRLTAADERADVLEALLRKARRYVSGAWPDGVHSYRNNSISGDLLGDIDAALKPTEGGGDDLKPANPRRILSDPHCSGCGHPDCNGQCFGDDMMGD